MQSKSLLLAVAAFAVTATGVHAYGGSDILDRGGLSEEQVTAIHSAQELREGGDMSAARDLLVEAGITEDTLKSIHRASQKGPRVDMKEALETEDFEAFKSAIEDGPLADIVTTEEDFEIFIQAHELRGEGDREEAKELLESLGLNPGEHGKKNHSKGMNMGMFNQLTEEQGDAFQVAKQSNDRATMRAIMDEAGIELGHGRS